MTRSLGPTVAWIAAGLLAVAGVVTLIVGLATPAGLGWFAYQPLANATYAPAGTGVFVSRTTVIGSLLLAIGLIGLAFLAGRRTGKKRS